MSFDALLATADRAALQYLGCAVTYTSSAGEARAVRGVFDEAYVKLDAGQPGVSSKIPAVFLRLADLPTDPDVDDGPLITVGMKNYTVREVRKDGQGGVLLLLYEA